MGFALQNRGALFMLDPAKPDALAPRKRPFHTIIPAFMEHGDDHIGFGIMGGANQPLAHAQFVSNFVDYGMNLQAAMETARFTVSSNFDIGCRFSSKIVSPPTPASSSRPWAINSMFAEISPSSWAAARPSTTTQNPDSTSPPPTPAPTAPPNQNPPRAALAHSEECVIPSAAAFRA